MNILLFGSCVLSAVFVALLLAFGYWAYTAPVMPPDYDTEPLAAPSGTAPPVYDSG